MRAAYRAALFHMLEEPAGDGGRATFAYHDDGMLIVEDGKVLAFGAYEDLSQRFADVPVSHLPGRLITPGFVDLHIHFPQTDIIAANAGALLPWLNDAVFPAEAAFVSPAHAAEAAGFFIAELLRNGTTTAMVFGSSHKASVDALFAEALARDMRLIAGKSLMDRHAPPEVMDTLESGRADTLALIEAWSGKGRLGYAITPRFAVTSSDAQLACAGEILAARPDVWLQTHLAENADEIEEVARLFPDAPDYLAVYERFGLTGPRSVFAHCVHLEDGALARMAASGSAIAFCPTSNLFLGSGLFSLRRAFAAGVRVGMGTDVGAGTSFSLLRTLDEAHKVGQLQGEPLDPFAAFYLATLGGARALSLGDKIGNLAPGKEADFLVLDPAATPLLARRWAKATSLAERLFALMVLADDRVVKETYVAGVPQHARDDV